MKRYLLITLMAIALSATAQQTPINKTRSNSDYSQVDNYLIGLKRLGIPTSETDNLDASGLPQNAVKIIYNTTLGRLRIYNPMTASWSDATGVDLGGYIQANPSSAQLGSIVLNGDIALTNAHSMALYKGNDQTETGERAVWTNEYLKMINPSNSTFFDVTEGHLKHSGALEIKGQTDLYGHLWINQMDENTSGNDFDIAVRNRTNGNLDKVSFNNFPFLPLTGGNIKGYVSIGQGEATTGFISDPNGYTGFAFGVPNFTSLQMRYQPNALGRGLQIYDPYDPTNVMEGNAEWKKVLVEGDAIEASSEIPQNANININGHLRVNGVYLGADKLDLNNTGYIDNVTSIFVRGEAGQISTANLGANRIDADQGHIGHAYFDVNSLSEGNYLKFFNGIVDEGERDYSELRTDNGGFQFTNDGVNLMDINYSGGSKFYNDLEVSGTLKANGGVDLGYSTFSGASDAGAWSFGRFGDSGKFRFDFANADVPFLGGLLVSEGIEAGNGISANNGETTGAYNIPLVAYGSNPILGLRSLGYGKSAGIAYSAGGLDFWIKGNSNADLTSTGMRPLRIADDGKAEFYNDVEISDLTKGIIMKSPNGTRYRVTINDAGDFVKTAL